MNHFPNSFLGGIAVAIAVHLVATWLYHRGQSVIFHPISARWRAGVERARDKRDREIASLRSSKDDLILATVREVLSTLRFFVIASAGVVLLVIAGLIDFLGRHYPAELRATPNLSGWGWAAVVSGLLLWFLAFFELLRSSNARDVLAAATKAPASQG